MIVVAIIGLLAAIAIPNFVRARTTAQTNSCIANLKQLEGAVQVWAIETGAGDTDASVLSDLTPYVRRWPSCGTSAYAAPTSASQTPTCPLANTDHVL